MGTKMRLIRSFTICFQFLLCIAKNMPMPEIINKIGTIYSINAVIDENRNLLCCNNGVYDFKNEIFREGYPDDYLSLCTDINYIELRHDLSDVDY